MPTNIISRNDLSGLIPEPVTREIIQGVTQGSAVLQMGRRLPNMTSKTQSMNVLDMLPMAYWVDGDTGVKQTTRMAWDKKKIYAEELAVIVPIPEAVLDDAGYDIWGEVRPRLVEAFGKKIDDAILFGTDKPTSWRDDLLTTATKAGAVVTATSDTFTDILGVGGVISKVEESGFMPTGAMSAVKMRAILRGLKDTTGQPVFKTDMQGNTQYALDGIPMTFPMNGSFDPTKALMIVGDFSQLTYAIRQDVTYKMLDQATIIDPTTKQVVYSLAQQDMVALRAVMRLGWEIPNPINAFQPDETKRSPFAVYKPASAGPNVYLSNLALGSLTLTPAFDKTVTSYTASTTNATNTITATPEDNSATVAIKNGVETVQNGSACTWVTGSNTVTATVTNGSASKQYTVTVTKS